MTESKNIGVVILAAGSSSRLGQPKQLVEFQNKTLLQHVIDTIAPFNFSSKILILGAHTEQIRESTYLKDVTAVDNMDWPEGIASSIRFGVNKSIEINGSLENILFLLSDQPYVSTQLIDELINKHINGDRRITACNYNHNVGVPAIFSKHYFPKLMELSGDVGAKKIIMRNSHDVNKVIFKKGSFDIDTPEDYKELQDKII